MVSFRFDRQAYIDSTQAEIFGSHKHDSIKNPSTAAYLRIEKGAPVSPPVYEFDEAGILLQGGVHKQAMFEKLTKRVGELDLQDEAGNKATLHKGDTFIIRRGSTMTVSSKSYGLVFKVEEAFMGAEIPLTIHSKI